MSAPSFSALTAFTLVPVIASRCAGVVHGGIGWRATGAWEIVCSVSVGLV